MKNDAAKLAVEVLFWVLAPVLVWCILDLSPVAIGAIMAGYLALGVMAEAAASGAWPRRGTPSAMRPRWKEKLVGTLFLWAVVGGLIALVHWEPLVLWGQRAVVPFTVCMSLLAFGMTALIWTGFSTGGTLPTQSPQAYPHAATVDPSTDESDLIR